MPALSIAIHALFALGLAQGLFLALQLWRLRDRNRFGYSHLLLALAAFMAVMLEQWVIYADAWRAYPHVLRATVWMPFLFGPGLWLFVVSLSRPRGRTTDALHYLPAAMAFAYFLPFLLQSGADKIAFVLGTHSIPLESSLFGLAKAASLLSYVIAIRWRLRRQPGFVDNPLTRRFAIVNDVFLMFLLALLGTFISEHLVGDLQIPSDVLAAVGFSLFIYAASLIAVAHWRDFALSLAPVAETEATPFEAAVDEAGPAPARDRLLDEDSTAKLYRHVCAEVRTRRLFREPGLKIDNLAAALQLPVHYLSYAINAGSGRNVQAWLNQLRVEDAMQALAGADADSVLAVGLAAGFNSKASFNRAFRAETGVSPSEFRARSKAQIAN
ncbi:MAG: helix-turn-helix domain-containing protein [Lysobacterales bacterium]|nr:AraC family transcriptional regulator [Rhodanobacteraceae bacterium]